MLETSFGLLFFLKTPKKAGKDERYVYIRITVDGVPTEFSTKRKWYASRWNQKVHKAEGNKQDARTLNDYLETLSRKVYNERTRLIEFGKPVTAAALKKFINGETEDRYQVLELFKEHNEKMEELVKKGEYAKGTFKRYQTSYTHTCNYIKCQYGREDLELKELDYAFIENYEHWLKTKRDCSHNVAMKYLSNFKKIVLNAVNKNYILKDPFKGYKMSKVRIKRKPLTQEEVNRMRFKKFSTERLSDVRDYFIFSCYTGLSYIDIKQLQRHQVLTIDGHKWLDTNREKTGAPVLVPLLEPALEILKRHWNNEKAIDKGTVFDVPSNQKVNEYLKEIATLCNIRKKLTFHLARHTFATTIMLSNDVPIETVSLLLGHATIKQTQEYAQVTEKKIKADMAALRARLNTNPKEELKEIISKIAISLVGKKDEAAIIQMILGVSIDILADLKVQRRA
jgi:integrase